MCRHLAYLGPAIGLRALLYEPPYSLHRQAWAPRRQRYGTVNADGFGVGWYAHGDPIPARYRQTVPMWADRSFADVARVTSTHAMLAAVRSATAGTASDASAACPYQYRRHLFSHNGAVAGWPDSLAELAGQLPVDLLLGLEARTDSALLWALVRHGLADEGRVTAAEVLAGTVRKAAERAVGRYNLLLTDGESIAATAFGDTLVYRVRNGSVVVASEPDDDESGWVDVPDGSVLAATVGEVHVRPIWTTSGEAP